MIREFLDIVLKNYLDAKKGNYAENEIAKVVRTDFPEFLEKITENSYLYNFHGSAGIGMWANCPYVAILDKNITPTVQSGYFPVYLFREDMKGVYLSIMFGTGDFKSKYGSNAKDELISQATQFREEHPQILTPFNQTKIDLATDSSSSLASYYEAGNIAAKYYEIDNLPSEEELQSDYWEMLDIYHAITGTKPDFLGIRDFIQKMLENYLEAKNDKKLAKELNSQFANKGNFQEYIVKIAEESGNGEFVVHGFFGGYNKFIPLPWLIVYRKGSESPFYIDFQFRQDMKGVYLSLTDSYRNAEKSMIKEGINFVKFDSTFQDYLNKRASVVRDKLYEYTQISDDFIENIDLNAPNATSASSKEAANILAKYYTLDNLSSEEELVNDFKEFINLYELIDKNSQHLEIKYFLENIFSSYQTVKSRRDPVKDHKLSKIFNEFALDLQNYVNYPQLESSSKRYNSYTHYQSGGSWDNRPYISISDLNSSKYLLSYSFTEKTNGVHLSLELNWGYINQQLTKELNRSPTREERNKIAKLETAKISAYLRNFTTIPEDFESLNYNAGINSIYSVFTKYYDKKQLPSETQLKTDLKEMLKIYNIVSPSREGLTALTNVDEINNAQELFKSVFTKIADETIEAPTQSRRFPLLWSSELDIWGYFGDVENHYFNPFGIGKPDSSLDNKTVCEINSPHQGIKRTTSGVFAKNSSGKIFLLHRGIFHGVKIKKDEIENLVEINDGDKKSDVILIGGLEEPDFPEKLKEFIFKVNEIKGGHDVPEKTFFEFLTDKGYFFDQKLVENFLLSLKVKPFVILTGNSGTGKTKVAQLFAKYLNPFEENNHYKTKNTILPLKRTITKYSQQHNGGWRLKEEELNEISNKLSSESLDDLSNLDLLIERDGSILSGRGYIEERAVSYSEEPQFYVYYNNDSPIYQELSQKSVGELTINFGKDNKIEESKKRHEIVPVGANWTENRHVIGFYNVITEKYQKTSSLDLILRAKDDITNPYFLILDEMNLSHVERYFSDFLSAMESEEEIELYQAVKDQDDEDLPPEKIKLSDNLSVIGTVNVDETTYMFSPKVLDRANTLEFLTQAAEEYMSNSPEYSINGNEDVEYLQNILSDIDIRNANIKELRILLENVQTDNGLLWDVISSKLSKYQAILKEADFDFGFRTINEIIRFMYVAWKYEKMPPKWDNWERYFDAQIMQKMLPKLHGSQKELSKVLEKLEQECFKSNFLTSTEKLKRMRKTLQEKRYVSFTG